MEQKTFDKLESCHQPFDINDECIVEEINARRLLTGKRFDFFAILFYIDQKVKGVKDLSYAISIYFERTEFITVGTFEEPGKNDKTGRMRFLQTLDNLIDDFQNDRFDKDRWLIPVDREYSPIDGAHRICCAAYFNRSVKIARFINHTIKPMNYKQMRKDLVKDSTLNAIALEATNWFEDLYVLFLWPKSFLNRDIYAKSEALIASKTDVVYQVTLNMSYNAIRNLMLQIYGHMDWVGNITNDFQSTYVKADEVWDKNGNVGVFLVRATSTEFILRLKAQIRDLFNIGLASIHSTDNLRETKIAANALFNENSFHFLQHARPTKYKASYLLFDKFKKILLENRYNLSDYIIDSSMVLALYGLRQANDLDYYKLESATKISDENNQIEEHDEDQRRFYKIDIEDLILSHYRHFCFNEIKFVSLGQLYEFKKRRYQSLRERKDADDIRLIESALNDNVNTLSLAMASLSISFRKHYRHIMRVSREFRNDILKAIGLYGLLKSVRDHLKKTSKNKNV